MTNPNTTLADELEAVARIIDPSSWSVMDAEKDRMLRKYKGQNIGYDPDQFRHKESMAKAQEVLAALRTPAPAPVSGEPVAWMYYHPTDPFPPSVRRARHESSDFAAMAKRGWTETPLYAALQAQPAQAQLGRFGHHPEAAIDYECEIDALVGMAYDRITGMQAHPALEERIRKAMDFRALETPGELRWLNQHFNGAREIYAVEPECLKALTFDRTAQPAQAQGDVVELIHELNNLPMVSKGSQFDGWLLSEATLKSILAAMQQAPVKLDWRAIAKAAGEHGVRYRTNSALMAFFAQIGLTQPQADAAVAVEQWQPIETAPQHMKTGSFLVTNNINARDAHGAMSHVWLVRMVHEENGEYAAFLNDGFQKIGNLTHFLPIAAIRAGGQA